MLVYVDETGDTGPLLKKNRKGDLVRTGATGCYALGAVVVDIDDWPQTFESLVSFRRRLRDKFRVPVRAELKTNYLIRGSGPLTSLKLARSERKVIYRAHLRLLAEVKAQAFAVVIDKQTSGLTGDACSDEAWLTLFQRLEKLSAKEHSPTPTNIILIHDEGEDAAVRKRYRRARQYLTAGRAIGGGHFQMAAQHFVEDPSPRNSAGSYFIQLADMVAYAGWRTYQPPSTAVAEIVPGSSWSEIGQATRAVVNSWKPNGSVPGVVLRT